MTPEQKIDLIERLVLVKSHGDYDDECFGLGDDEKNTIDEAIQLIQEV